MLYPILQGSQPSTLLAADNLGRAYVNITALASLTAQHAAQYDIANVQLQWLEMWLVSVQHDAHHKHLTSGHCDAVQSGLEHSLRAPPL